MAALAITTPLAQENIEELFTFLKQCKNRTEWLPESNRKLQRCMYPSTEKTVVPILLRQKEDLQFIKPIVQQVTGLMHNLYQAAELEDNYSLMKSIDQLYFGLEYYEPCSTLNEIPTTEKLFTELATLSEQLSKYKTPEGDFDLYDINTTLRHRGTPQEIEEEEERRRAQDEQDERDEVTISRIRSMYRSMSLTQIADHYNRSTSSWSPYIKSEMKKYLGVRR